MKRITKNNFWIIFSDILISLIFVILVLFITTYSRIKQERNRLKVEVEKYEFLSQMENQIIKLTKNSDFIVYDHNLKKFLLKDRIQFATQSYEIPEDSKEKLLNSGLRINEILEDLIRKSKNPHHSTKFLLIIEGLASRDNYNRNFELSYLRAKSVYDFWRENDVKFNDEFVEIIISGSGTMGSLREKKESKNQSIMIQIIPKNVLYSKKS